MGQEAFKRLSDTTFSDASCLNFGSPGNIQPLKWPWVQQIPTWCSQPLLDNFFLLLSLKVYWWAFAWCCFRYTKGKKQFIIMYILNFFNALSPNKCWDFFPSFYINLLIFFPVLIPDFQFFSLLSLNPALLLTLFYFPSEATFPFVVSFECLVHGALFICLFKINLFIWKSHVERSSIMHDVMKFVAVICEYKAELLQESSHMCSWIYLVHLTSEDLGGSFHVVKSGLYWCLGLKSPKAFRSLINSFPTLFFFCIVLSNPYKSHCCTFFHRVFQNVLFPISFCGLNMFAFYSLLISFFFFFNFRSASYLIYDCFSSFF